MEKSNTVANGFSFNFEILDFDEKIEAHTPRMWFGRIHLKSSCGIYTLWLMGSSLIFSLLQTFHAHQNHLENMLQWRWSEAGSEMLVFNKFPMWFGCSWLSDHTLIWPVLGWNVRMCEWRSWRLGSTVVTEFILQLCHLQVGINW